MRKALEKYSQTYNRTLQKRRIQSLQRLSRRKNEDGTAKYPLMAKNAEFWKKQNEAMEEILKTLS